MSEDRTAGGQSERDSIGRDDLSVLLLGSDIQHLVEEVECPACGRNFLTHSDVVPKDLMKRTLGLDSDVANAFVLLPRVSSTRPKV